MTTTTTTQEGIELSSTTPTSISNQSPYEDQNSAEIEQPPLEPTDTGKAAWLVLAGCTVIQLPVWGFPIAFGVFQEYYTSHPEKLGGDTANVAVIGTTITV